MAPEEGHWQELRRPKDRFLYEGFRAEMDSTSMPRKPVGFRPELSISRQSWRLPDAI